MVITEKIQQRVQRLPVSFQIKVLDFVEHLVAKAERETTRQEEKAWSNLSLPLAMRGMEDEHTPTYTIDDLKEVFQ